MSAQALTCTHSWCDAASAIAPSWPRRSRDTSHCAQSVQLQKRRKPFIRRRPGLPHAHRPSLARCQRAWDAAGESRDRCQALDQRLVGVGLDARPKQQLQRQAARQLRRSRSASGQRLPLPAARLLLRSTHQMHCQYHLLQQPRPLSWTMRSRTCCCSAAGKAGFASAAGTGPGASGTMSHCHGQRHIQACQCLHSQPPPFPQHLSRPGRLRLGILLKCSSRQGLGPVLHVSRKRQASRR